MRMLGRLLGEHIELVILPEPGLGVVRADRGQVEQVIINLAVNARDAMEGGGRLTLETRNVSLDRAYVSQHPGAAEGDYVMLAVTDSGTGMDAATPGANLRAILHHQGAREGHRTGSLDGIRDRQAERRHHLRVQ